MVGKMEISNFLVSPDVTILEAMQVINENTKGIVFVTKSDHLIGTVTDGDIRRYIIKGGDISASIGNIANHNTIWLESKSEDIVYQTMKDNSVSAIPILDSGKRVIKIYFSDGSCITMKDVNRPMHIPMVIMAGGKGSRLKPYTDIMPKPLIPIGNKTITERIIDNFLKYSDSFIYMIVNYRKEFIKAYFRDGDYKDKIRFIDEEKFLGTGGGLKLLEGKIQTTFFLSNCDILINADYTSILEYHLEAGNCITMVCAKKCFNIPYGTVDIDQKNRVVNFVEKPSHIYYVNTGFYIIEPNVLKVIPKDTYIHVTDIITDLMNKGEKIGTYIIGENEWMDMGQFDELNKMKQNLKV